MEVLIETYDYRDAQNNFAWGQIVRFQALNGTGAEGAASGGDCCDVGSRVPIIQVQKSIRYDPLGENLLQVTSAIFNDYTVEQNHTGNSVFNFLTSEGFDAPDVGKCFNITITQLPPLIQSPVINNLNFLFLF